MKGGRFWPVFQRFGRRMKTPSGRLSRSSRFYRGFYRLGPGPGEREFRTSHITRFYRDRTAQRFDMPSHHRQAHAASFHPVAWLQGVKHLEDFFMELSRNARSIVTHREAKTLLDFRNPDLDRSGFAVVVL